jgi:hypothetical protein
MRARPRSTLLAALVTVLAARAASGGPICGEALPGLAEALAGAQVVLFGEIHGTVEMPALYARAVCAAATRAPVTAALELPEAIRPELEALLAHGETGVASLLTQPPWSAPAAEQYGLTSVAMLELLLELRRMRDAGLPITVAPFDRRAAQDGNDDALADSLATLVGAEPRRLVLALTGNLHARIGVGAPWNPALRFAGTLLRDRGLVVRGLFLSHAGGSAWICTPDGACGERAMRGNPAAASPAGTVTLGDVGSYPGLYDGQVAVGTITASPPAISRPAPPRD